MKGSRVPLWTLALGATYLLALLALTASVWLDPQAVIGHVESDTWKHLWGDAWLARDLGSAWPVPTQTQQLWFPDGGRLYNLDPITGFVAAVFAPVLGTVLAHNVVQGGSLVAGALAAYLLARRLTGDNAASAVAGAAYGFSAHLQGAVLSSGIGEAAHVAWMPLAVLLLITALERSGWRRPAMFGLCLFLSALASWYYGLVACLACGAVLATWLLSRRDRGGGAGRGLGAPLLRVSLGASLAALLILPFALSFAATLDPVTSLHGSQGAAVAAEDLLPSHSLAVASLADFLAPGFRVQTTTDKLFFCSHVGFLPLTLAAVALLTSQRRSWLLALGAVLALMVCLGPVVHADRATPLIVNPVFGFLGLVVPRFELVRNLERVQVALTLCLAMMAALGLRGLMDAFGLAGARRGAVGLVVALVVVAEANAVSMLGFPLPSSDSRVPEIYRRLAEDEAPGAILEIPVHDGPGGLAFWYQVHHGRPLPMNLDNSPAPSLRQNRLVSSLMPGAAFSRYFQRAWPRGATPEELEAGRVELVEIGFSHVVLTDGRIPEPVQLEIEGVLESVCGAAVAHDVGRGIRLYRLERGVSAP